MNTLVPRIRIFAPQRHNEQRTVAANVVQGLQQSGPTFAEYQSQHVYIDKNMNEHSAPDRSGFLLSRDEYQSIRENAEDVTDEILSASNTNSSSLSAGGASFVDFLAQSTASSQGQAELSRSGRRNISYPGQNTNTQLRLADILVPSMDVSQAHHYNEGLINNKQRIVQAIRNHINTHNEYIAPHYNEQHEIVGFDTYIFGRNNNRPETIEIDFIHNPHNDNCNLIHLRDHTPEHISFAENESVIPHRTRHRLIESYVTDAGITYNYGLFSPLPKGTYTQSRS